MIQEIAARASSFFEGVSQHSETGWVQFARWQMAVVVSRLGNIESGRREGGGINGVWVEGVAEDAVHQPTLSGPLCLTQGAYGMERSSDEHVEIVISRDTVGG